MMEKGLKALDDLSSVVLRQLSTFFGLRGPQQVVHSRPSSRMMYKKGKMGIVIIIEPRDATSQAFFEAHSRQVNRIKAS
jgi:hypothetical protein